MHMKIAAIKKEWVRERRGPSLKTIQNTGCMLRYGEIRCKIRIVQSILWKTKFMFYLDNFGRHWNKYESLKWWGIVSCCCCHYSVACKMFGMHARTRLKLKATSASFLSFLFSSASLLFASREKFVACTDTHHNIHCVRMRAISKK